MSLIGFWYFNRAGLMIFYWTFWTFIDPNGLDSIPDWTLLDPHPPFLTLFIDFWPLFQSFIDPLFNRFMGHFLSIFGSFLSIFGHFLSIFGHFLVIFWSFFLIIFLVIFYRFFGHFLVILCFWFIDSHFMSYGLKLWCIKNKNWSIIIKNLTIDIKNLIINIKKLIIDIKIDR